MTETFAVRPDLGQHLAVVASLLRDLAGGAHWDVPGIRAEIHRAKHLAQPAELAHAVVAWCTTRLDLRAPIGLADDGPHWHTGRTPEARVPEARCAIHEHELAASCRACPVEEYEPTDAPTLVIPPEQAALNARGAALVRAELAKATSSTPTPDWAMRAAHDIETED